MRLSEKEVLKWRKRIEECGLSCFGNAVRSFLEDFFEKGEKESEYNYFIHSKGEDLIGYLLLSVVEDEGEIVQVAIKDRYRKKGFSATLLDEVLKYCEQTCVKSIFLEVRVSNNAALSLYRKKGFFEIGIRNDYYCDPVEDAVVMKKIM